jgi:hypothetical protein
MPYLDDDGEVECGHGDEAFCEECGGNCYCDEEAAAECGFGLGPWSWV